MRARASFIAAALMTLVPRVALACPVCFGQNDSPLAGAINAGVTTAVDPSMLACTG